MSVSQFPNVSYAHIVELFDLMKQLVPNPDQATKHEQEIVLGAHVCAGVEFLIKSPRYRGLHPAMLKKVRDKLDECR